MPTLVKQLLLKNFLSFGPDSPLMELGPLNLVIGPNGAGKSNLGAALEFLRRIPAGFYKTYERSGAPRDFIWRGKPDAVASVTAMLLNPHERNLGYELGFKFDNGTLQLEMEFVQSFAHHEREFAHGSRNFAYLNDGKTAELRPPASALQKELAGTVSRNDTVLAQVKAPGAFPEIGFLQETLANIRLFRKWSVGPGSPLREPSRADDRQDFLNEEMDNLPQVLGSFIRDVPTKKRVLKYLAMVAPGFDNYTPQPEGGLVSLYLQEDEWSFASSRLSDGTLKWLALLAVLLHPTPPPLVFMEEPELGLHPDMIPTLAELLRDAAERTQVIVTTHSRDLVDCFTATPEVVLVCDKRDGQTVIRPAQALGMTDLLAQTTLGTMWAEGHIGGNRW